MIAYRFLLLLLGVGLAGALAACGVPQEDYDAALSELEEVRAMHAQTTEDLNRELAHGSELEDENLQLTEEIATHLKTIQSRDSEIVQLHLVISEHVELQATLEAVEAELRTDLVTTNAELQEITQDREAIGIQLAEIVAEIGEIETLSLEISRLQDEIAVLEARRQPLIVETHRGGFRCTGSMEPKITCLDEATWLENFRPEDIVIGAVISFTPTSECNLSSTGPVAHRVIAIQQISGILHYLPRGDNNDSDDGCWIPVQNVNRYIIELHKDVRPENQSLRNKVNSAKASFDTAKSSLSAALSAYQAKISERDAASEVYYGTWAQYCGGTHGCSVPSPQYETLLALYNALVQLGAQANLLYSSYQTAYSAYSIALASYNAALLEARHS